MKKLFCVVCLMLFVAGNVLAADITYEATELVKTSSSWDGEALPQYPEGVPEVTILRIIIPQGAQLPIHEHPVINAGVLLTGELTVTTVDNKVLHLKAGDPIVEVVDKWHYGKNEGSEQAEIVVFYAGIKDMPITIKQ